MKHKNKGKFKVGDKVQLSKKFILEVLSDMPDWYTSDILTIIKLKQK